MGFYALDVGRVFATATNTYAWHYFVFLCPRCRAGLCDPIGSIRTTQLT